MIVAAAAFFFKNENLYYYYYYNSKIIYICNIYSKKKYPKKNTQINVIVFFIIDIIII